MKIKNNKVTYNFTDTCWSIGIDLSKPFWDMFEWLFIGDIISDENGMGTSKILRCDGFKTFLTSSVPKGKENLIWIKLGRTRRGGG